MSIIPNITNTQARAIQKVASKNNGAITAKEYRKIIGSSTSIRSTKKAMQNNFAFTLAVEKKREGVYLFTLYGIHLSTNRVNSLSRKDDIRYRNAIKKAFEEWYMTNIKKRPKTPFESALLVPIHYNRVSRDDDSGTQTNKTMRDYIIRTGFVEDDTRKHIEQRKTKEVLQKEYKVEMYLIDKSLSDYKGVVDEVDRMTQNTLVT